MKKWMAILLALCVIPVGIAAGIALADDTPPGQLPCSHGNSDKPCKPDPQPDNGQDCLPHGPNQGGENEDHCAPTTTEPPPTTTEPPPTTTTPTTTTPTTPTPTTPTPTTPVTTTPVTTTPVAPPPPPTSTTSTTTTTPPDITAGPKAPPKPKPKPKPKAPPAETSRTPKVGTPAKPAPGKPCPPGTREFDGACHAVVQGKG